MKGLNINKEARVFVNILQSLYIWKNMSNLLKNIGSFKQEDQAAIIKSS